MAKQNPLKKLLGLAVFGAGGFLFVRGIIGQFPGLTPNQMLVSGLILITAGGWILKEVFGIDGN